MHYCSVERELALETPQNKTTNTSMAVFRQKIFALGYEKKIGSAETLAPNLGEKIENANAL